MYPAAFQSSLIITNSCVCVCLCMCVASLGFSTLNMPGNLENSAVATGLEKVSFHSNPKERQCQRMLELPYSCTHLTR